MQFMRFIFRRIIMFKRTLLLFITVLALHSAAVSADNRAAVIENRAINITMYSNGGSPVDFAALGAVRRLLGYGVASGVLDTFDVYAPRLGGPIPKEGGISACVEAGFATKRGELASFLNELRSVKTNKNTAYTLEAVPSCVNPDDQNIACTMDVMACPDGSFVGRQPPSCAFAPCPGPK
jgi:hypothetical protein